MLDRTRETVERRKTRRMPAGMRIQADWAVIGVFILECLREAFLIAAPMLAIALALGILFGGGEE